MIPDDDETGCCFDPIVTSISFFFTVLVINDGMTTSRGENGHVPPSARCQW